MGLVVPTGFSVPPPAYLAVLVLATLAVGAALLRERPQVTDRTVLAFAPWMAVGSTLYVCYQLGVVPASVAPFASSPAVYLTTFVVGGVAWLAARRTGAPTRVLAGVGLVVLSVPVAVAVRYGAVHGTLAPGWPLVGLVVAVVLAGVTWAGLRRWQPDVVRVAGAAGALVVFGHALDAATTAVGVDVLGFGEQSPLSRSVMQFAGTLPTASAFGVGWLFVVLKLALAVIVVVVIADYAHESPTVTYLLLAFVAAVGVGPGAHNFLLFAVTQPVG